MTINNQMNAEEISQLVSDYKWDELDAYYEKLIVTGTKDEKELLADGYISYFAQLTYDFACGKISEVDISYFLDIVAKAEILINKELWYHRAVAYHNIMDRSLEENKLADFFTAGNKASEAYQKSIENGDEGISDNYNAMALISDTFALHHRENQLLHWQQGIQFLKHSIVVNPQEANWELYIKMLHLPYPSPNEEINAHQANEKINFHLQLKQLAESVSIYPVIAQAYLSFKEHLSFYKAEASIFPELEYQDLLEKATLDRPTTITYFSASDTGGFFHEEGVRLSRIDMLMASMYYYEKTIGTQEDHLYGIRRAAEIYEDISQIYAEKFEYNEANLALNNAFKMYTDNIAAIESDFSPVTSYAELMERSFYKDWYKNKPSLSDIKQYAKLSIAAGQGHYLIGPMILIRSLLIEHKEDEIIAILTRELILHERSLLPDLKALKEMDLSSLVKLGTLIETHIQLFEQVNDSYFIDPKIDWEMLNGMSDEKVLAEWESRKTEIRDLQTP